MNPESESAPNSQAEYLEAVRIPHSSRTPNMAENYRCMLVWDTRTNMDVGWLMVRKKAVSEMRSEEVAAEMSQCQWRNWNLNGSIVEFRETLQKSDKGIDLNRTEEASTSSESKSANGTGDIIKVDCSVQVETEALLLEKAVFDASRFKENKCAEPLNKKTKLGNLAVIESSHFDKLEVVGVSVEYAGNVMKDELDEQKSLLTENSNEKEAITIRKRKNPHDKINTSSSEVSHEKKKLDHGFVSVCQVDKRKEVRKSHSLTLHDCPECGKSVKQKSLYMHLLTVHNIKSAVSMCNVCNRHILEVNLMMHRKMYHPERFKFDMIACSGCQKEVRALDFDAHKCVVDDIPSSPAAVEEELTKSSKYSTQIREIKTYSNVTESLVNVTEPKGRIESSKLPAKVMEPTGSLGETCSDCSVVFSGDELRYHDCKMTSTVRLKRLQIKSKKPPLNVVPAIKVGNLMCEDCGKLFNDAGRLDQHDCKETFIEEHYFELNEDDANLALVKSTEIREKKTFSNVTELLASAQSEGFKNDNSKAKEVQDMSPAKVTESIEGSRLQAKVVGPTGCIKRDSISILPANVIELSGSKTLAKVLQSKGSLSTAKIIKPKRSLSLTNMSEPRHSLSPLRTLEESTQDINVETGDSLSPARIMDPKYSLASAMVATQPPKFLKRGEVFTFTVTLLDINKNSLQIKSACLTVACKGSSVLQFRLELLQDDGSVTLQTLWISICNADQPGSLLKCLTPCHIPCRQLGKDQLQFSMSCDLDCDSTDYRFKLVVATKQKVLCYSRDVIIKTEPEQIQETNEEGLKHHDSDGVRLLEKK